MATVVASARYGVGVYGASEYGVVDISIAINGVSATGAIENIAAGGFEVDVTERITTGVEGTGSVGSLTVNTAAELTGVVGTFTLNGAGLNIRSINRVPVDGVSGTTTLGIIEVQTEEALESVSATGQIGTIKPNVAESVTGVVGTFSVNTVTATGTANVTLVGVEGITAVEQVQVDGFEIDVSEPLNSVSATGAIGSLRVNITEDVTGVIGTFTVGTPTVTGVITVFTATDYDRRNVANTLPKQTSSRRRAA